MTKGPICIGCPIVGHGSDFTEVEGTGSNGVLIVGEASGEMEARDSLPFRPYAPAGGILQRTFARLGFDRQDFAITNLVRCRPRQNLLSGMSYESSAVNSCKSYLEQAYSTFQPRVILALGGTSFDYLTGNGTTGRTVSHLRGYVFSPTPNYSSAISIDADLRDCVVVPTYHPSFIRRGSTHLFGVFARDVMRAVNIAAGRDHSYVLDDPLMSVYRDELLYQLKPSIDEAWAFYHLVRSRPESPLAYDLETFESTSLDEDAQDEFQDTRIRQIQFTLDEGSAIAMPWNEEFRKVVAAIMALPNPKISWNGFGFDNRMLRVVGESSGNPTLYMPSHTNHDAMLMWKRWQPELPANLQYAATFVQWMFPWKHLSTENLPFYGCCDSDVTLRMFNMLTRSMTQKGILASYVSQVADLHDLPAQIAHHGLTLSAEQARTTMSSLSARQAALLSQMDGLYPESERTYSPDEGYKKTPKQVEERRRLWNSERMGILIGERTVEDNESEPAYIKRTTEMVERTFIVKVKSPTNYLMEPQPAERWCKPNPFSPMSRQQIMRYAKLRRHEIPTKKQPDGTISESLTIDDIDLMAGRTKDNFYRLIGQHRRLTEERKLVLELELLANRSAIHPTFAITQDGKIGARNPSLPEPHTSAAQVVVARPGHLMVQWRWPTQWQAILGAQIGVPEMADLTSMAKLADCHLVAMEGFLRGESDRAILEANRLIFGTAQKSIMDMRKRVDGRWPQISKWQEATRKLAHQQLGLTSKFGEVRWFYEVFAPDGKGGLRPGEQAQPAIQFLPEADSVGVQRWRLGRLRQAGLAGGMVGMARDWLMWEVASDQLSVHVRERFKLLAEACPQLGDLRLLPEVWVGDNWGQMTRLDIR